jgi:hypothetical protein
MPLTTLPPEELEEVPAVGGGNNDSGGVVGPTCSYSLLSMPSVFARAEGITAEGITTVAEAGLAFAGTAGGMRKDASGVFGTAALGTAAVSTAAGVLGTGRGTGRSVGLNAKGGGQVGCAGAALSESRSPALQQGQTKYMGTFMLLILNQTAALENN